MKNILIAAVIVGVAAAGVILYMRNRDEVDEAWDEVSDSASNAYDKMNDTLRRAGKKAKKKSQEWADDHAMA